MSVEKFVIEGLPPIYPIPDESIGEIIYQNLLNAKNQRLLIDGHTEESLTSEEFLQKTCSLGVALRNSGYGPGTVIAITSQNNLEFFVPVVATFYVGATIAPISQFYTPVELNHILNISKPKIVFCSKQLVEKYKKLSENLSFIEKIIVIDGECIGDVESMHGFVRKNTISRILTTPVEVDSVALLLCSSGSTGLPKCVMLTHKNINAMYNHFRDPRIHQQNPVSLLVLPFFHGYGFFTTLGGILMNATTIFLRNFAPDTFLKTIQDYKVTRLFLAPSMIVSLSKAPLPTHYDLSSIHEVFCGSAPLKESTEEDFKRRLNLKGIRQGYGLSETAFAVTLIESDFGKFKTGSCGKVLPHCKLAVRDLDTAAFLGPHELGEICIKGESVMKGYYNNFEATRNTFKDDSWFLSGDIGYFDEDGYLYITDRIKELIKYKGFQVAPAELEALLLTHPDIMDSGVVGLPDKKSGELPLAFVVKKDGSNISEKEIEEFVRNKLSPQKWLRGGVYFVDAIPRISSGKIARTRLRLMIKKQSKL